MANMIAGMGIQALAVGVLTQLGLITPNPFQQIVAGILFLAIALSGKKW
jgi:hypothetical protein